MPLLIIEGHRHSGKTHLIEKFLEQNTDSRVKYYKFQFAKYIDDLEIRDQEDGPGVHYFSIANVMTILELNKTLLKDHFLVFDRCLFSAYVWSIYRNRMDQLRLLKELKTILTSDLYVDSKVLYVERGEGISTKKRDKDYFGNFEDASAEKELFERVFSEFMPEISNSDKGNTFTRLINNFDEGSISHFNHTLSNLINNSQIS
jgi:hypothetical protein